MLKKLQDAIAFASLRRKSLKGLMDNGTFVTVHFSDVPGNAPVVGSRFIHKHKKDVQWTRPETRLLAQNDEDGETCHIATKSPTVHRFPRRLFLRLTASLQNMTTISREVTPAYIQRYSGVDNDVCITSPG